MHGVPAVAAARDRGPSRPARRPPAQRDHADSAEYFALSSAHTPVPRARRGRSRSMINEGRQVWAAARFTRPHTGPTKGRESTRRLG
jgi:hypothetical protein